MNKRISKKLKAMATETVRDFTVQEAWDKVAHHLATDYPKSAACYFIDEHESDTLQIHAVGYGTIIKSTKAYDDLKHEPAYLEPEDVTLQCQECDEPITVEQDLSNVGHCDDCMNKVSNDWLAEQKHESYEYRNMKI